MESLRFQASSLGRGKGGHFENVTKGVGLGGEVTYFITLLVDKTKYTEEEETKFLPCILPPPQSSLLFVKMLFSSHNIFLNVHAFHN